MAEYSANVSSVKFNKGGDYFIFYNLFINNELVDNYNYLQSYTHFFKKFYLFWNFFFIIWYFDVLSQKSILKIIFEIKIFYNFLFFFFFFSEHMLEFAAVIWSAVVRPPAVTTI